MFSRSSRRTFIRSQTKHVNAILHHVLCDMVQRLHNNLCNRTLTSKVYPWFKFSEIVLVRSIHRSLFPVTSRVPSVKRKDNVRSLKRSRVKSSHQRSKVPLFYYSILRDCMCAAMGHCIETL